MLRKTRVALAFVCIVSVTLLFLDFTGTARYAFGWLAKIQFWPAVLALNIGVILALLVLTLLFGRVYCSIICPLGIFQDVISRISGRFNKRRFRYSPALSWLRYTVLAIFVGVFSVSSFVVGAGVARAFVSLLSPYSAYGRIANGLFAPVYRAGNNLLAHFAERIDSYTFYSVDVIGYKGVMILVVPLVTLVVLAVLAWRNGRTYCNTICPVGTVLGFVSNYSLFKIRIDADQCNQCGLCERNCKASCIDSKAHTVDYSRCVACMNCMDGCRKKAISFVPARKKQEFVSADHRVACMEAAPSKSLSRQSSSGRTVHSRRHFFTATASVVLASAVKAQDKKVDGGLAEIKDKVLPDRVTKLTPPGAISARHFARQCTACQLCVSACPNHVLRPSDHWMTLMQPEMEYDRGYCRPECTKCSEVCPTGAIRPITQEVKTSLQIGHAVWVMEDCIVKRKGVKCGNCERHCPNGAITMIASDPDDEDSLRFPSVDTERCIGCGACEYVCPSRPFSAIYVVGHEVHRSV